MEIKKKVFVEPELIKHEEKLDTVTMTPGSGGGVVEGTGF